MAIIPTNKQLPILAALAAGLICLCLYLPSLHSGFVNFDDPDYVLNNPVIRDLSLSNLVAMFAHTHVGWWMPLTWLSLAIDYHIWGLSPTGFHLTNILLHALNTGLVVLLLDAVCRARGEQLTPKYLYAGVLLATALFFGAHPLRVESVAWVTERKDVLNGFFTLCSVFFYLRFVEQKRRPNGSPWFFYGVSFLCFTASLMAKSVSVVLPAMLVVLDWFPLGRLRDHSLHQLIMEKLPFWLTSIVMILCTLLFAAQSQYLVTYEVFPLAQRLAVSGNAVWEYWQLLLLPLDLSPFNIIPDPIPVAYGVKAFLVALFILSVSLMAKSKPALGACVFCFLLPLLPVLAFFQNGDQSYADRFTYLPSLSPALFLALLLSSALGRSHKAVWRRTIFPVAVVYVAVLMFLTVSQQGVWRSPETVWTKIIRVEPTAISYKERGRYYHGLGRYPEAIADFTAALERLTPTLKPYAYNFYAFRAESHRMAGNLAESIRDWDTAIGMHPHPAYYYHRGLALRAMGRDAGAKEDFGRAGNGPLPITWID